MSRSRNPTATGDDHPRIGNYRLLKTIGKGNFAKVKLAKHILTEKEVTRLSSTHPPNPTFSHLRFLYLSLSLSPALTLLQILLWESMIFIDV